MSDDIVTVRGESKDHKWEITVNGMKNAEAINQLLHDAAKEIESANPESRDGEGETAE